MGTKFQGVYDLFTHHWMDLKQYPVFDWHVLTPFFLCIFIRRWFPQLGVKSAAFTTNLKPATTLSAAPTSVWSASFLWSSSSLQSLCCWSSASKDVGTTQHKMAFVWCRCRRSSPIVPTRRALRYNIAETALGLGLGHRAWSTATLRLLISDSPSTGSERTKYHHWQHSLKIGSKTVANTHDGCRFRRPAALSKVPTDAGASRSTRPPDARRIRVRIVSLISTPIDATQDTMDFVRWRLLAAVQTRRRRRWASRSPTARRAGRRSTFRVTMVERAAKDQVRVRKVWGPWFRNRTRRSSTAVWNSCFRLLPTNMPCFRVLLTNMPIILRRRLSPDVLSGGRAAGSMRCIRRPTKTNGDDCFENVFVVGIISRIRMIQISYR